MHEIFNGDSPLSSIITYDLEQFFFVLNKISKVYAEVGTWYLLPSPNLKPKGLQSPELSTSTVIHFTIKRNNKLPEASFYIWADASLILQRIIINLIIEALFHNFVNLKIIMTFKILPSQFQSQMMFLKKHIKGFFLTVSFKIFQF